MHEEILDNWTRQVVPAARIARKWNRLLAINLEKVVELQLESLRAHVDLLLDNLRVGSRIRDLDTLQAYAVRQPQVARVAADKVTRDAQVLARLGGQFNAEWAKLVQEQIAAPRQVA